MKRFLVMLLAAASPALSIAQTPAKATTPAKPASSTSTVRLPPGVPPARGVVKTAFSLKYQDMKIGTGQEAEPNKLYKVHYTGWLAADGQKFDSSYDHRGPLIGADGKPELDAEGKPKLGDPQPISVPQGFGRVIPGFDQGFAGMKVGGKRRLFIPWQLAYGAGGRPGPDAAHPGIPPRADLIFDVELLDVNDLQLPPNHPGVGGGMPGGRPMPIHPVAPGSPTAAPAPGTPGSPAAPSTPPAPTAAPAPAAPPADKPQLK